MLDAMSIEFGPRRLPMVHQSEAAECGLSSLAMVASYFGFRTDLAAMRARFAISLKGANLAQLIQYADRLKLHSRPLRLELDELPDLKSPCILHWDLNHFVVLKHAGQRELVIHDPAAGVCCLSYADAGKHFTGVALELSPSAEFKQADEQRKVALSSLMGRVQGLWPALGMVLLMALALEAFALVSPLFNQWVVDEALVSNDGGLLDVLVLGFALLLLIQTAISFARDWTVMYFSTHLNLQWMSNVFTHVLRLPVAWFERRHLGDIVSRFGSVGTIQHTLTVGFIAAILDGLMAVATLLMMLVYSPLLSTLVLSAVCVYLLMRVGAYRPLREASQESLALAAKEQSCFLETMRAIQPIKLFGRELDRRGRWLNLAVDSVNRGVRTQKFMLWFGIANTFVFGLENLLVFWLGAHMVMNGKFTVGMLFAFTAYGGQFGSRMASLVDKFIEFRMLSLHAERLGDIVLEPPEASVDRIQQRCELVPKIELIDVSFRYGDGEPWIVRNLSLVIEAGESVALVGPSGCGKTTLIKLILGLMPPQEGEIRFGGVAINQLGLQAYREMLAVVMQDDQLLAGSLAENISFFDPQVSHAQIEQCAELAAIHEEIVAMPMAYQTLTGDMGTSLSGGQKQRVLLARALYKSPKVLVLDEATSHLDVERERQVNNSIDALKMTRIFIAHRPETIAMAKRVIVMRSGKILRDFEQSPESKMA